MLDLLASPEIWLSLATLTFLEIVLGVDNVVFVSVAAQRLKPEEQERGRDLGIWMGAAMRVVLLFLLVWLTGLTHATLFQLPDFLSGLADPEHPERLMEVTLEDVVLFFGGLFLLWKGTMEIHHAIEGIEGGHDAKKTSAFWTVVAQMTLINVVFSLDSVLTAVGMTQDLGGADAANMRLFVMVAAVVASTILMVASAKAISAFLDEHPTAKMLALSFILLVGVALIADGLGFHIPRGYLYFAIAFSLFVETLNILARGKKKGEVDETV